MRYLEVNVCNEGLMVKTKKVTFISRRTVVIPLKNLVDEVRSVVMMNGQGNLVRGHDIDYLFNAFQKAEEMEYTLSMNGNT